MDRHIYVATAPAAAAIMAHCDGSCVHPSRGGGQRGRGQAFLTMTMIKWCLQRDARAACELACPD